MTIDGRVDDWDWSGRIVVFADSSLRGRYSVEVAAMWDQTYLYLAAKWSDPTPMFSVVDPRYDPDLGWRADAWQLRFRTDHTRHVTAWYFTEAQQPSIAVSTHEAGMDPSMLNYVGDGAFEQDVAMAYRQHEDGNGYTQEIRLPWSFVYQEKPEVGPGLVFRMGNEFLWGDPSGKGTIHRYSDNMQPGVTSREFYWQNQDAWGNVTLLEQGNHEPRMYLAEDNRLQGAIPLRIDIPANAARLTLAINDADGNRVRNLGGDLTVEDYTIETTGDRRTVEVRWDGKDDDGELVSPGRYQLIGLTQEGIGAAYEMSFYNPGSPPWATADGSGAWGGDHPPPHRVARAGDWMVLAWSDAEGGTGLIGIGPEGRKQWGEKRGAVELAANAKYVYGVLGHGHSPHALCRYGKADGSYIPFENDGGQMPFEWPVSDIIDSQQDERVTAIAADDSIVVLGLAPFEADGAGERAASRIAVIDAETGQRKVVHKTGTVDGLALAPDGVCFAIIDGEVVTVDLATGDSTAVRAPGLARPVALAADADGHVLVFDAGPDSQVKAYSPEGELVYTSGKQGGRPLRGRFDEQGTRHVASVAVDAEGRVWTVESHHDPRRVSVWSQDGSLARDYIGNTGYSATGTYLNPDEPDAAYVGSVRMAIDRETRSYDVTDILWVPESEKGEAFSLWNRPHHFANPSFVRSRVSGEEHTYIYFNGRYGRWHGIYMQRDEHWQPVAVVGEHRMFKEMLPELAIPDAHGEQTVYWNDLNQDGAVQPEECVVEDDRARLSGNWNHTIGSDLIIWGDGLVAYHPVRFTDEGAPVYLPEGLAVPGSAWRQWGPRAPIDEDNLLIAVDEQKRVSGVDVETMEVLWRYPNLYDGVHGSHHAPMPEPGMLIGPLKVIGVVDVNDEVGRVFAMRGNLGQDFYMTADGLYVGAMFRDVRLPGPSLPSQETALIGQPMEMYSNGSEPFNGWLGKQTDGAIRMLNGIAGQAAMMYRITGLESIKRFEPQTIDLDADTLARADAANAERAAASDEAKTYTVTRASANPVDDPAQWDNVPAVEIAREGAAQQAIAQLSYDDEHLYVRFQVTDRSPWRNHGKDHTRLFKTGDAVDLHMSTQTAEPHTDPQPGDQRILFANYEGNPVAVLMRVTESVPDGESVTYRTNWARTLAGVGIIDSARVVVETGEQSYTLVAAIPLEAIELAPEPGKALLGDMGFISSDENGQVNVARTYWSNKATNLVSDEPLEAWLYPEQWGTWQFE
ncbi:MAG: sugar-binding protein [Phycisphaeraceae bacterium]